jgi:hypothetical protein
MSIPQGLIGVMVLSFVALRSVPLSSYVYVLYFSGIRVDVKTIATTLCRELFWKHCGW